MNANITVSKREVRRSFALGVFNGAAFQFAERLIDPPLILTWFVSQLTTSNLLIGLVSPLGNACWFLPQIFVSAPIQRMRYKMPVYTVTAVIRAVAWLLLATAVWLAEDPAILLLAFFILYAIARLGAGLSGLSFFDVIAKTIPAQQRGTFFGWRMLSGEILGLGAGVIVKLLLDHTFFPRGHALLFFIYCAVSIPAMYAFILIHEPPGETVDEVVTLGSQLRRAGGLLRENLVFRRYILVRLALGLADMALPFYGVYAKMALGASEGMVGVYVMARVGAQLLLDLPWGRLSDRLGNRLALQLLSLGNGLTVFVALVIVMFVGLFNPQGSWLPYLVVPLFILDGALRPAQAMVGGNFLLELVPEAERPLYLGLSNTLMGVTVLISGLAGVVVSLFGFSGLFLLALSLCLVAYVGSRRLPEPRVRKKTEGE